MEAKVVLIRSDKEGMNNITYRDCVNYNDNLTRGITILVILMMIIAVNVTF